MSSKLSTAATPVARKISISGGLAVVMIVLATLALLGAGWFVMLAHSALPELDGSLAVRGITGPVSVTRDGHGLPTIEAATFDDLFFAQGYVTAQDRLFQMELMRRSARGELAELVGEVALAHDRQQRILGIRDAAERGLASSSAEERQHFSAYTRGVNAFIDFHRDRLPLEFRILHSEMRPWTLQDCLAIAYQMAETLSTTPRPALTREKILEKLGPELGRDLYVNASWHDHLPSANAPFLEVVPPGSPAPASVALAPLFFQLPVRTRFEPWLSNFLSEQLRPLGSNNWVLAGSRTVSGKPLLSNDMHLGHQMPNLWYEAHLRSAPLDVVGLTLPGYPYVIVGHNQRVAWGFTNLGPTVEDAFIEKFNASGQYLTPEGWKQAEQRREVIRVKDRPDVVVDVESTRHGPLISELIPGERRKIALRWTLYDGIRSPFFRLDTSENWSEFRNALSQFDCPGQNVVYADTDGNIGYQATGKVPIRAAGDGSLPVDGSNNGHEWIGYVPFDKLPWVFNPPAGIIATANGRITPDNYPYSLSVEWEAPWRTDRIYRVLTSGRKFSSRDMLSLETDIYSELDRFLADKLVYAVDHSENSTPRARQAANILRQWNGQMDGNSPAPTVVTRARTELKRLVLEPKLGTATETADNTSLTWKSYRWMMETVWLENLLTHEPARWLPATFSSYNDLLAAAVEAALKDAPPELNSWRWGPENSLTIQNPILGRIPILRRWTGPGETPQSGGPYTVKAAGRDYGPSERFTADLSALDHSTLNLVTGESGNFLSPYYMDQWHAWYSATTFVLPFSKTAVENVAAHRLILGPK